METRQILVVVLVLGIVVGGVVGTSVVLNSQPTTTTTTTESTTTTTDGVPDFIPRDQDLASYNISVPDWEFLMVDVDNFSISDAYGKFLILEFFATWCPACEYQNADNVKIFNEFGSDRLCFVQLSTALGDTEQMLRDYKDEYGLLWDMGYAIDSPADDFLKLRYLPTLVLIDQTGTLRWIREGTWRFVEFNATLVELGV